MPLDLLVQYWEYIVGFLAVFLLAFWTFDEKDQSDSIGDTVERVGERATSATGGVVGAAGSLAVGIIAVMSTIGDELVMSVMEIVGIVGGDPVLAGGVATGLLGAGGLSGAVAIKPWQFVVVVLGLLVIGVIWREQSAAN
jgi:hypothetical protein